MENVAAKWALKVGSGSWACVYILEFNEPSEPQVWVHFSAVCFGAGFTYLRVKSAQSRVSVMILHVYDSDSLTRMFSIAEWGLFCSHPLLLSPAHARWTPINKSAAPPPPALEHQRERAKRHFGRRQIQNAGKNTCCSTLAPTLHLMSDTT